MRQGIDSLAYWIQHHENDKIRMYSFAKIKMYKNVQIGYNSAYKKKELSVLSEGVLFNIPRYWTLTFKLS